METAEQKSQNEQAGPPEDVELIRLDPDLDFIRSLCRQGGGSFKKCFQCGTCSATCSLSSDRSPFPRKEMAWATWGARSRLFEDPDVWLCYQCNDCSTRCPRGARPGDVLGAVRQQCVEHYAFPRFLGRWVNQPHCVPVILGIPAALLTGALVARTPIEKALGLSTEAGEPIIYAYSTWFPHWLLNTFFGFFSFLVLVVVLSGCVRFWRTMKAAALRDRIAVPGRSLKSSIIAVLKRVVMHDSFTDCTKSRSRYLSHFSVFFGFLALTLVTLWVITARYNPLIRDDFIYPFSFWNPWKILANVGGIAIVAGCLLMIRDRFRDSQQAGSGSYFDWALIAALLLAALTGFVTELLHYQRLEPHRHIAYFVHLVFVFVVLMYLPYSKLAHLFYRFTALVFVEHYRPDSGNHGAPEVRGEDG